jgi:hypothetical protein
MIPRPSLGHIIVICQQRDCKNSEQLFYTSSSLGGEGWAQPSPCCWRPWWAWCSKLLRMHMTCNHPMDQNIPKNNLSLVPYSTPASTLSLEKLRGPGSQEVALLGSWAWGGLMSVVHARQVTAITGNGKKALPWLVLAWQVQEFTSLISCPCFMVQKHSVI